VLLTNNSCSVETILLLLWPRMHLHMKQCIPWFLRNDYLNVTFWRSRSLYCCC